MLIIIVAHKAYTLSLPHPRFYLSLPLPHHPFDLSPFDLSHSNHSAVTLRTRSGPQKQESSSHHLSLWTQPLSPSPSPLRIPAQVFFFIRRRGQVLTGRSFATIPNASAQVPTRTRLLLRTCVGNFCHGWIPRATTHGGLCLQE